MKNDRLIQRDLHEADLGYPQVHGHSMVTQRIGGPGRFLCRLGFHFPCQSVTLFNVERGSERNETLCLRCGRSVATVRTAWGEGDDVPGPLCDHEDTGEDLDE